jgi:hypothetical protein
MKGSDAVANNRRRRRSADEIARPAMALHELKERLLDIDTPKNGVACNWPHGYQQQKKSR